MNQPEQIQETNGELDYVKRYVKSHMNRLMRKASKAFDVGHEDAEVSILRPAGWEADTFEATIKEHCDAIQEAIGGEENYLEVCLNYTLPTDEEEVPYNIILSACWRPADNPFDPPFHTPYLD